MFLTLLKWKLIPKATQDTDFIKTVFNRLFVDLTPLVVSRSGRKLKNSHPFKVMLPEAYNINITHKNKYEQREFINNSICIYTDRTMRRNQLRDVSTKLEEKKLPGKQI